VTDYTEEWGKEASMAIDNQNPG